MARVDCRAKGVDMADHADKTWLREPLVTRPERGLLHPDFSPEGDKVLDIEYQIVASVKWAWERKAWAELRQRRNNG